MYGPFGLLLLLLAVIGRVASAPTTDDGGSDSFSESGGTACFAAPVCSPCQQRSPSDADNICEKCKANVKKIMASADSYRPKLSRFQRNQLQPGSGGEMAKILFISCNNPATFITHKLSIASLAVATD